MGKQLTIQQNNASLGRPKWKFQLTTDSQPPLILTYIPDGWEENELSLIRDKQYHGVIKAISTKELIFHKEGKNFIQTAYENDGINCEVSVTIYRWNGNTMEYDLYHTGVIDFSTYSIDETGVFIELISDSFWDKFKTRDSIEVNLRSLTSIEGYNIPDFDLNDITIPDTSINNAADYSAGAGVFIDVADHVISCILGTSNFNETQSQDIADPINDKDSAFFKETELARIINVAGTIEGEFIGTGGSFDASIEVYLNTLDVDSSVLLTTGIGLKEETGITSMSFSFTFSKNITIYPGQSVILQGTISPTDEKFSYSLTDFDVTESVTGTPETDVKGFLTYEAFLRCSQLTQDQPNPFHSEYCGRTDTPLTQYASDGELMALIKGIYFREFSSEPISITFKDLFNSMFSQEPISLNHELISGVNKLRVEDLEYAYDSEVVADISSTIRTQNIKKSIYPDLIYSKIELGYNKYDYEEAGGLFEYNTKLIWSTVIRAVKATFNKVSKYRGDYSGIKKQILTTDLTEDAKGDNDNFFVTLFRDGADFVARVDEDFDYVGGSFYANKSLNLDITPARNLRRQYDFLRGSLLKNLGSFIRWQASEKPSSLETRKTGETSTIIENTDIRVNDLDEPLWHPEIYEVDALLTYDQLTAILANPKGLIKLDTDKYGWIMNLTMKTKDEKTSLKMLRANLDRITPS